MTELDTVAFIRKWALELPNFKQGSSTLQDRDGNNCCLGVACIILKRDHNEWLEENGFELQTSGVSDNAITVKDVRAGGIPQSGSLPDRLSELLGISGIQTDLIQLNDGIGYDGHTIKPPTPFPRISYLLNQSLTEGQGVISAEARR